MEQEKKQAVALMRYSAIAPLIAGTQEDYESLDIFSLGKEKEILHLSNQPFFHSSTSILKIFSTSTSGHENLITPSGWLGSFPPYLKIST